MLQARIIITALILIAGTAGIFSCNEASDKENEVAVLEEKTYELVEANPKEKVVKPDEGELIEVEKEFTAFKFETNRILAENEAKMLALKIRLMNMKAETRTRIQKELDAINTENEKLKSNIKDFKNTTKDNWESFKNSVNKDVDQLEKSIIALSDDADKKE